MLRVFHQTEFASKKMRTFIKLAVNKDSSTYSCTYDQKNSILGFFSCTIINFTNPCTIGIIFDSHGQVKALFNFIKYRTIVQIGYGADSFNPSFRCIDSAWRRYRYSFKLWIVLDNTAHLRSKLFKAFRCFKRSIIQDFFSIP